MYINTNVNVAVQIQIGYFLGSMDTDTGMGTTWWQAIYEKIITWNGPYNADTLPQIKCPCFLGYFIQTYWSILHYNLAT